MIDADQKRLIRIQGALVHQVTFGMGLLGRIEQGGTFEIDHTSVLSIHWETNRISVHVVGRIILFRSIGKQHDELRSGFRPLQNGLTLEQAEGLLKRPNL